MGHPVLGSASAYDSDLSRKTLGTDLFEQIAITACKQGPVIKLKPYERRRWKNGETQKTWTVLRIAFNSLKFCHIELHVKMKLCKTGPLKDICLSEKILMSLYQAPYLGFE